MLTKLPPEILRRICMLLPSGAAINLLLTCRTINFACDEWRVWRAWRDVLGGDPSLDGLLPAAMPLEMAFGLGENVRATRATQAMQATQAPVPTPS